MFSLRTTSERCQYGIGLQSLDQRRRAQVAQHQLPAWPAASTRFIRSGLLDTLHQDYIRTARAKGFAETSVILRHALRNALIPSVTFLGLQFGGILEGAFIVESVFAWPGIGRLGFQALGARDYPTVQAVVLLAVFLFLMANLVVDIAYAALETFTGAGEFCQYDVGVASDQVVMASLQGGRPDSCTALQAVLPDVVAALPALGP